MSGFVCMPVSVFVCVCACQVLCPVLTMGYHSYNLGVSGLQHLAGVLNFAVQAAQVDRQFFHFHRCVGLLHDQQKIPLIVCGFCCPEQLLPALQLLPLPTPNLRLFKNLKEITSQASEIKLHTCARRRSHHTTTPHTPQQTRNAVMQRQLLAAEVAVFPFRS